MLLLVFIAFVAGTAIAAQSNLAARLGVLLANSLLATCITFLTAFLAIFLLLILFGRKPPAVDNIPYYLWFSAGLLSAFGIATVYWLIPKMGAGPMVSSVLAGQLVFAMTASHYGWFQMPVIPISLTKLFGASLLLAGVAIINFG
jgi:transporter family-2 protein